MKASNVIKKAINDPRYLNADCKHPFLCALICKMKNEGTITERDSKRVRKIIMGAFGEGYGTLLNHFKTLKILEIGCSFNDPEYKEEAMKYWHELIANLITKGD